MFPLAAYVNSKGFKHEKKKQGKPPFLFPNNMQIKFAKDVTFDVPKMMEFDTSIMDVQLLRMTINSKYEFFQIDMRTAFAHGANNFERKSISLMRTLTNTRNAFVQNKLVRSKCKELDDFMKTLKEDYSKQFKSDCENILNGLKALQKVTMNDGESKVSERYKTLIKQIKQDIQAKSSQLLDELKKQYFKGNFQNKSNRQQTMKYSSADSFSQVINNIVYVSKPIMEPLCLVELQDDAQPKKESHQSESDESWNSGQEGSLEEEVGQGKIVFGSQIIKNYPLSDDEDEPPEADKKEAEAEKQKVKSEIENKFS